MDLGALSRDVQNAVEIKMLKQQMEDDRQYADAVLKMGQEVTEAVDLHVNKATGGHLDTFA